jgi:YD repeat-containing protein
MPPDSSENVAHEHVPYASRATRDVADNDVWAKIVWAAMHLEEADVPNRNKHGAYPLALIRAIAATWAFSGLRSDEIRRLRVGCVRWQCEAVTVPETGELLPKDATCLLDVPANKTKTAFTKPVHPFIGRRIEEWEAVRPSCLPILDSTTGEYVNYLFVWKQHAISGHHYINRHLIPLLCRKAGVPDRDARGPITSHRARSTITTQVYNANARVSSTKLAKAYVDADYFGRNVVTVEVLIDQEAVLSGAAAAGETWKYYDLGHGFCTYSFYAQCEHRMACAKCPFYLPKDSARAQILEGKANLARMLELIPLTEDERAAVEDGQEVFNKLLAKLADIPTPVGPTPRTLAAQGLPVLPPTAPRRTPAP